MYKENINSHIIPRHYLKHFANDRGCIFTYPDPEKHTDCQCMSKGGGKVVKNTATETGYYSPKTEQTLDQKYENQGSHILRKILNKHLITSNEKELFAKYITSFIFRVPATKQMIEKVLPKIVEDMNSPDSFLEQNEIKDHTLYYEFLNDPTQEPERVRQIFETLIENEHKSIYDTLLSREWWVAETISSEYFITSNNPLFYTSIGGMRDRDIQITFPISKRMALIFEGYKGTSKKLNIEYYPASSLLHNQVDLINKRTASNSDYLYSPRQDNYVQSLLKYPINNLEYIKRKI
ncbi:hypothetical protein MASR2M15_23520 [Anaerolineales bacterium]